MHCKNLAYEMKNDYMIVARRISIKAERLVSGKELLRVMSFLPNAKPISEGSCYSFGIDLGKESAKLMVECCRDSISLEFRSKSAEDLVLRDISILTLSMLAYLKDSYSVKLESIYPILISSLRDVQIDHSKMPRNELETEFYVETRNSNFILSEIAIKNIRENVIRSKDMLKFSSLLESISKIYWNNDDAISKFCISSGVGIETVKWALNYKRALVDESV
jgi:hypothetical protein